MCKRLNVLSLFDGMGCFYMALKEAGFTIGKYYASEIEKHPILFTTKNVPGIIHLYDVEQWKDWGIDWSSIDIIGGGSPCQGFSFAGKQLNFQDPRSRLFFTFVDILNHVKKYNPGVLFLLENVNMQKEHLNVISNHLKVQPVNINSRLQSAQNRNRYYWTNIRTRPDGFFNLPVSDIPQPQDAGVLLTDILQPDVEVPEKYYLSAKMVGSLLRAGVNNKAKGNGFRLRHQLNGGKSLAITVSSSKQSLSSTYVCCRMVGRHLINGKRKDIKGANTEQRLEPRCDRKTNCLTTVEKDNVLLVIEGVSYKLRRLTPTECAMLQTIPGWVDFSGFSDTAIYKMLGNGWTVKIIMHILSYINITNENNNRK